ncbi:hypothetical protein VTK73DRAFT_931 [Phialemonium thermophilum]|uniref:Trans-2,3-dihydro-3-hydroxyanthranilate isomerase n=1 Tax=Phialemonium thermophilum TaxID=223376 RepID=A0ABR3VU50_9PEZI
MAPLIKLDFVTLDVFTDSPFLGNPLAVVLVPAHHRAALGQETKQRIAREFNLSETVFLHVPDKDDQGNLVQASTTREIDIFTIDLELPFAGHPTIGTAHFVLNGLRWLSVDTLHTRAGPIRITATPSDDNAEGGESRVRAQIPHDVHVHGQTLGDIWARDPASLEKLMGTFLSDDLAIRNAELAGTPVSIVRGMTFLLVELPSIDHLGLVSPSKGFDLSTVPGLLDNGPWGAGFLSRYYYVRVPQSNLAEGGAASRSALAVRARMVELGFEDPATGSAACTLASYLAMQDKPDAGVLRLEIAQGVEMGRRSDISVDVTGVRSASGDEFLIKDVFLGGTAAMVMSGTISV